MRHLILIILMICILGPASGQDTIVKLDTCKFLHELLEEDFFAKSTAYKDSLFSDTNRLDTDPIDTAYIKALMDSEQKEFSNRLCNCLYVDLFSNGLVHEEGVMKDCIKSGKWIVYGDSNHVNMITNYKNGLRHGEFLSY